MNGVSNARRVSVSVTIGGHDATSFLEPYLLSFSYTDNASGKADSLQLELQDREGKWANAWAPHKGTELVASFRCVDWFGPGRHGALNCGVFVIDEVEYAGGPDKVSIKAVTASLTGPLRETAKTKAWEGYSLRGVAAEVASKHGLTLLFDAPAQGAFVRQDQREESDLAFVSRLARERGMSVKVHDGKLALYAAKDGDARSASLTIPKTGDQFSPTSYKFKEKSEGTAYTGCEINYLDPDTQEVHSYAFDATGQRVASASAEMQRGAERAESKPGTALPGAAMPAIASVPQDAGPSGMRKVWCVNQRVESEADARAVAQNILRQKNAGECTGSVDIMGHPGLVAGMTVALTGFGRFSGTYFVEKAEHKIGSGYTTSAEIRRILEY